jgi:predicted esterase
MHKPVHFLCLLLCLGSFQFIYSQGTYYFSKGLGATAPSRYGREALYTDELAYQLYTGNLKAPVEGAVFSVNERGQNINWQPVKTDSLHRFRPARGAFGGQGGGFGGRSAGYLYLTYSSPAEKMALLNIKGNSGVYVNGILHMGDAYSSGWMYIPVKLKKGLNELYVRGQFVTASLDFPNKPIVLKTEDATLPSILLHSEHYDLKAAVVVFNLSPVVLKTARLKSSIAGKEVVTDLPGIPAYGSRKVSFYLNAAGVTTKGKIACMLTLLNKNKSLDEGTVSIEAVEPGDKYSVTFTSGIDGSLQYYAVTPQTPSPIPGSALFLSVHGAGVEAIGQARAYQSKDWGTLVAATNRRPRGFNWEDWGRLDALEVLDLAKQSFKPEPRHIYLTGHSMGGHGTWFLGATYPGKWAAIGACSGYPTLKGYGSADGLIPDSSSSGIEQILLRASNQSDVIQLANNYKPLGVYILHGDADKTVSVNYARQMRKVLADFHTDMSYYEYPNGEHWFGDQSVDWKPLFEFFKWHALALDSTINTIDFTTASPGISASYRWATIQQQLHPLKYSRIRLNRNKAMKTITGTTENIKLLKLKLEDFGSNTPVKITLDGLDNVLYTTTSSKDSILLQKDNNNWAVATEPDMHQKGPQRYGTFKDAFNNRMIYVYSTKGTKEENEWSLNKARYDAETWYYRGNGAVDIVADKDFIMDRYPGRGVILYGNATTNGAWKILLSDCPIQMERGTIKAGDKEWKGDDLGAYFVWPIRSSAITSVAVIGGTGLKGMNASNANQYFAGASGFPDFMIFNLDMLKTGSAGIKMAGFFDNNWQLAGTDFVENK